MNKRDLISLIKEDDLVSLCQNLVQFRSVNPPGNELQIAEYVARLLGDIGLQIRLIKHDSSRASLLARLRGRDKISPLLFSGHLDVVPVGTKHWLRDPFKGDLLEGKLWGRGTSDMKGGLAAMIMATKALVESGTKLEGDLIILLTADEESNQIGAREAIPHINSDPIQAVIIAEPSNNDVYIAEKGALWLEITTMGKTAHGSTPHLGHNAITMMMEYLKEVDKILPPNEKHPLLGGATHNIGTIHGGVKTNVVPDYCTVTLDLRTIPGQDHSKIIGNAEELIEETRKRCPNFQASIKVIKDLRPVMTSGSDPIVKKFCDLVAEVTQEHPIQKGAPYYTDGGVFVPNLNIPMIICGPGDPKLAHQPNEYIEIHYMVEAAKIYALAAANFLKPDIFAQNQ